MQTGPLLLHDKVIFFRKIFGGRRSDAFVRVVLSSLPLKAKTIFTVEILCQTRKRSPQFANANEGVGATLLFGWSSQPFP